MGNEISTPATAVIISALNAPRKSRENLFYNKIFFSICSLPTEIWFEILAFVNFHEAPNIFLVNRYLLAICQVYFHSGTVGQNKCRNVRDLIMQLREGLLTILVKVNGTWQSVPVPEVDPPKIFNAFGKIIVKKGCHIQAIRFLHKFQSLLTKENNEILCARNSFANNFTENVRKWFWQFAQQFNSSVVVDEKQFFLNWIAQRKLLLKLFEFDRLSAERVVRCLVDKPQIADFNGRLSIVLKNERNLCGLEEDAKLIYGWISSAATRHLEIQHFDAQKARELMYQVVSLFEEAHESKVEAEKMDLTILLPNNTIMPMEMLKIYNGKEDQLATLRTFFVKSTTGIYSSAYVFYTKPIEYRNEIKEEFELFARKPVYFL